MLLPYRIRTIKNKHIIQDIQTIVTGKEPTTVSPVLSNHNPFQTSTQLNEPVKSVQSTKTDGVYQLVLATSEDTVRHMNHDDC